MDRFKIMEKKSQTDATLPIHKHELNHKGKGKVTEKLFYWLTVITLVSALKQGHAFRYDPFFKVLSKINKHV